jgi:hypothetical protein
MWCSLPYNVSCCSRDPTRLIPFHWHQLFVLAVRIPYNYYADTCYLSDFPLSDIHHAAILLLIIEC